MKQTRQTFQTTNVRLQISDVLANECLLLFHDANAIFDEAADGDVGFTVADVDGSVKTVEEDGSP